MDTLKETIMYYVINGRMRTMENHNPLGFCQMRGNGQITIPPETREYLSLKEGDTVAFYSHPDGVVMAKVELVTIKPKK